MRQDALNCRNDGFGLLVIRRSVVGSDGRILRRLVRRRSPTYKRIPSQLIPIRSDYAANHVAQHCTRHSRESGNPESLSSGNMAASLIIGIRNSQYRTHQSTIAYRSRNSAIQSELGGGRRARCRPSDTLRLAASHLPCLMRSATRSPIMRTVTLMLARTHSGMIEASTTRRPSAP